MLDTFLSPKVENLLQKSTQTFGVTEWNFVVTDRNGFPTFDVERVNDARLRGRVELDDLVVRDDDWYERAVEALAPVFSDSLKALLQFDHNQDLVSCCSWMAAPQLLQGEHFRYLICPLKLASLRSPRDKVR